MKNQKQGLQIILKSLAFAANKHRKQKRKDKDKSPYIIHPIQVANILCSEGDVTDPIIIAAALLHDTVEDTETLPEELEREFGPEIRSIVEEVTDDKRLPKMERKRLQIEHAAHKSQDAQQVKIADKISNIRDTVNFPPPDWNLARKMEYLEWSKQVISRMKGSNQALEKLFYETYDWALNEFKKIPSKK
jgi:guanosine-3',5'-bis(diphosphate) 3'-pyrophosphohydrolase